MSWSDTIRKQQTKTLSLALANVSARALKPPPKLTVSEWADSFRKLSPESSAEVGAWHTSRAEYQREILDAVSDPSIESVTIMSCAQVGKTEMLLNLIGYHIHQDPSPILLVQPTLDMAQTFSKDRLAPMLRDSPVLQGKVADPKARDSGNTTLKKNFFGGHITMCGANSPASLASRPIRVVLFDEVDRFPVSAGSEGDPIDLARKRSATFWNRKEVSVSTPTIRNASRIEGLFENTDKREYHVPCPDCGHHQVMRWSNVHWTDEDPDTAFYACEECGGAWDDAARYKAIRKGEWRATAPFVGRAGFRLSGLCSPWTPLSSAVADFLQAKKLPETLRVWVNTYLGESWEDDGERLDDFQIASHREDYNADSIPKEVVFITAGIDVQDDRLEMEVLGHGRDSETWSIEYRSIFGDPASGQVWAELDNFLSLTYKTEDDRELSIKASAIDTGGHHTQAVYKYCKPRLSRRVFAIKGVGGEGKPIVGRPSTNNHIKCKLFPIGVDTAKEMVYSHLKIKEIGAGYCHFPKAYTDEYFAMLTAEKVVRKYHKGFHRREWVKVRPRNEALDCRVYALAALSIVGVNVNIIAQRSMKAKANDDVDDKPKPKVRRKVPKREGGFVNGWR